MSDSLSQLSERLREFVIARDWERFHNPKNLVLALASEIGELAAEYRWVDSKDSGAYTSTEDERIRVTREVADVGILLLLLSNRLGIDLIAAMNEKIDLNAKKYPLDRLLGGPNPPST